MRDPNRLYKFYENLRDIHMTHLPDWRFGQFMINFIDWYYNKYGRDLFYIEEDKMSIILDEFVSSMKIF